MKTTRILFIALLSLAAAPAAFSQTTLAKWTFETSLPATAGPFSPETGSGSASGSHAGAAVYSTPAGNGSAHSYSANTWAVGDYWQFTVSTVGQSGIKVRWDQVGSNTGPKNYNFFYSTDGVNFTQFGSTYSVLVSGFSAGTFNPAVGFTNDLSAITALGGVSTVYFRLVQADTVSINNGTVASGGTGRVDDFEVTATGGGGGGGPVGITTNPSSRTNNAGTTATFTVTGSNIVSYLWLKNGGNVTDGNASGTTGPTLTITNVIAANAASYQVVVSDNSLSVTSSPDAVLTVIDPAINTQPATQTVIEGTPVNFTVVAGGTPTLTYQWRKDGVDIGTATTSAYSIPSAATTDAGSYTVVVTNGNNLTATSSVAVLTVNVVFTGALPMNSGLYTNNFDSLGTVSNAWVEDNTLLGWYASQTLTAPPHPVAGYRVDNGSGTSGSLYSFGTTSASDRALGSLGSGTPGNFAYGARFTNDHATLSRSNITITYTGEQWRNGGNTATQTLAFSYRISSNPINSADSGDSQLWTTFTPLDFNTPTVGASAATLDGNNANNKVGISATMTNVVVLPGKEFFIRWKDINDGGNDHGVSIDDLTVTSDAVTAVVVAPTITSAPQSRTNNFGTTATFTVAATGTAPFDYFWSKDTGSGPVQLSNGGNISGANSQTLAISAVTTADAGTYYVTVQNSAGSDDTLTAHPAPAVLTVNDPGITSQPASVTAVAGDNANFFVTAVGTQFLSYQWQRNGVDFGGVSTAGTLTLTNVTSFDVGSYTVVITNGNNNSITSSVATLTIVSTPPYRIARWDFNDGSTLSSSSPVSASGGGTSALLSGVSGAFGTGTSSDPVVEVGLTNAAWNTAGYPAAGVSNKTAGVRFNISTVGYGKILLTWEQRHSDTASKYSRLQYTVDGTTFVDGPLITMTAQNNTFVFYSADLSGYAGVNDNSNFGFRIVNEFESSAIGTLNSNYVGTVTGYSTGGTKRFDLVSVFGSPQLNAARSGSSVIVSWSTNFGDVFNLEQKADLNTATWSAGPATSIVGSNYSATIPNASGQTLYRLRGKP